MNGNSKGDRGDSAEHARRSQAGGAAIDSLQRDVQLVTVGAILRAAADDELTTQERSILDAHLRENPESRGSIQFERDLRHACRRALTSQTQAIAAPSRLFASIEQLARDAKAGSPQHAARIHDAAAREAATTTPRHRRRLGLWVGACLFLVLGITSYFLFFAEPPTFHESPTRARAALAGFLKGEHRRCSLSDRALNRKMVVRELADAPAKYQPLLGKSLSVGDVVKAGYKFLGAGRCIVPGPGASVHLVFGISDADQAASGSAKTAQLQSDEMCDPSKLSLFIQTDTGDLPIVENKTYRLETENNSPLVAIWLRDGLIYYLITESEQSETKARKALGAPDGSEPL